MSEHPYDQLIATGQPGGMCPQCSKLLPVAGYCPSRHGGCGWNEPKSPLAERVEAMAARHGQRIDPDDLCVHEVPKATCTICKHGIGLGAVQTCRSCGADIVWCRTENRRNMPVDAAPSERGNLVRIGTQDGKSLMSAKPANVAALLRQNGQPMFISHFVTCDDRDEWRRKDLR